MIFRQIAHDDLGCASYLVGDEQAGVAAVVDPRFEIDEYLELARYVGVRSRTCSRPTTTPTTSPGTGAWWRRRARRSTSTGWPRRATSTSRSTTAGSWSSARCGARAAHARPPARAHSFLLIDLRRGEEPWAVLSGDSLFVGDVAGPISPSSTESALGISRSLHSRCSRCPRMRGMAGASRRLDVRRAGHGSEDLLDGRL